MNKYDQAFLKWFERYGWQIRETLGQIEVWRNDDAHCHFKVTIGMIERLMSSGLFTQVFPPGEWFTNIYVLDRQELNRRRLNDRLAELTRKSVVNGFQQTRVAKLIF